MLCFSAACDERQQCCRPTLGVAACSHAWRGWHPPQPSEGRAGTAMQLVQAKGSGLGNENINSLNFLTVQSCPPSVNSLFDLLYNVWAIKKWCSLLDFYSDGEEGADDRPSAAPGRPLGARAGGGYCFLTCFSGSQPKRLQRKLMWKGREKGVCVHACSHEPLGWPLAAVPAQH